MNEQLNNTNPTTEEATTASESAGVTNEAAKVCHNCKNILTEDQKFCPYCGETVEKPTPMTLTCANCGLEVNAETKFCPNCGGQITVPSVNEPNKKSKKKLFLIGGIAVAAVAIIVTAIILFFVFREIPVEDITLSETKIELKETETKNISCTVYPEKATDKTVTWTSSDNSVATVNSYGMITAVGKGTCTVTAKSGEQTETVSVTVKSKIDLKKLYDDYCDSTWARLGSDGSYLSIDTNPFDKDDGDSRFFYIVNSAIEKINGALGLPDSLYESMNNTSWSMGKQSETFDDVGVTVTWTYHPDKGLEVTYKLK